ncbi:MAG: translation initiation factor translation initiation factor [Candidatus Parcubacteria bacterium]|jgi:translation initiation factor IF-2
MNSSTQRPPIVAVLGHVDHGKSTLLDYIRKANTVAHEAGGITQHVAAYEVVHEHEGTEKRITFIDTPGHAAFQAIRARGAKIADIAILVVAADDGVKAQTLEALESIRSAGTPFIVAINKIDKPTADLSRTQASLLEKEVFLEQLGGDIPWVAVSAKTGQGIPELLDLILLVAEVQELKGDATEPASGYVVEAHRDPKRGIAATLIIRNGVMRMGECVSAGSALSPIRIMEDHKGKKLSEATFSTPVTLVGFNELPAVGSEFTVHANKKEAEVACAAFVPPPTITHAATPEDGKFRLPVIVRVDTQGSLDAIMLELPKIGDDFTALSLVHAGIGDISENDVKAALASAMPDKGVLSAVIAGFNVGVEPLAKNFAIERGVSIEHFSIIYKLTERLTELLKQKAPKREVVEIRGRAKIIKVFSSKHDEHLIGAGVLDGVIEKGAAVRVHRRGTPVGTGSIITIQHNRQSVDRVQDEGEFGAQISLSEEPAPGDTLECIEKNIV